MMNSEQGATGSAFGNGHCALAEEVPVGYKRTEVGVIPEEWALCPLRNIIEKFVNGGTPSTKNAAFWSGNIPWITGADILNQTVAVIRRHITEEAVHNSSTSVIAKGNLLIVSRTGVGKLAIAPCDIAISQDFTGVIPNKEKILAKYLFRHFDFCQHVLAKQNQGTSIKGITRDTLAAILIPLPSLSEQRAIAEALSAVDGLLAALEALIAKKRAVKQAAMQQLLTGKSRLPGFSGTWETTTIGEIATITTGNTPPTHDAANYGNEYLFVSPVDLGESKYVVKTEKMLSQKGFAISRRFPADSILFVSIGSTIGKCGIAPTELTSNQQINAVLPSPSFSTDYLYYTICSVAPHIKALAGEQAVPIVNKTQFSETIIPLAPLAEQRAIAAVLSDMDAEIAALERRRDKTRSVKQSMMQQLLTGRVRLVEPEQSWR